MDTYLCDGTKFDEFLTYHYAFGFTFWNFSWDKGSYKPLNESAKVQKVCGNMSI